MKGLSSILFITILLFSCENFPDPITPELPMYSESGNDVGGCLIFEKPWVSRYYEPSGSVIGGSSSAVYPCYVSVRPNDANMLISTDGRFDFNLENPWPSMSVELFFNISISGIEKLKDLSKLEGASFTLVGDTINYSTMIVSGDPNSNNGYLGYYGDGVGELNILVADFSSKLDGMVLSGTYSFRAFKWIPPSADSSNFKIADVVYGRFDYLITNENFEIN